jgi:ABC-type amino acid transport substrate-binding protein
LNLLSKNNSEIENKTIYSSYKELKEVKIAVLEGTIFKKFSENLNQNFQISEYKSRKEIIDSLRNKKIEAYITTMGEAQNIIMYNDDITYLNINNTENPQDYKYSFVAKNENKNTLNIFQSQYEDYHIDYEANYYWNGFDESLYNINKTSKNGYISKKIRVGLRMDDIPFSYNNSKGELTGYAINHIYRTFDNVELLEFKSNEELVEAVQKGTVNVSAGYFSEKENIKNNYTDISFFYSRYKLTPVAVILYENSNSSKVWKINNSIKDFKNKKLGILGYKSEDNLNDSAKKLLNISNDKMVHEIYLINNLYISLLKEEIDAIIIDKPIAEYYSKHFDKLTYFPESMSDNSYGLGFFNETLKNEFNEFLKKNYNEDQLNRMLDNWINNENYEIDKNLFNLDGTKGTISYLLDSNKKPIAFLDNEMTPKGFEFELLYKFAKEYGYKIEYGSILRRDGTFMNSYDLYLGCLNTNNTYEVERHIFFSNPIYKSSTVLAVKTKNKKDCLTFQVLDKDYNYKSNNDLQIFTRVLYKDRNTSCIFPKEYKDTILINCSISGFVYDINGTMTGFDFLNTSDRIKITYSTIKADNFFNADLMFKDDSPEIIDNEPSDKVKDQESDIFTDKITDKETDKNSDNNGDKNKEGEDDSKRPINSGDKSSDKSSLSIAVIIAIIGGVVLILLIITIICVVRRKLKNKAGNVPVKVADNSNVSNEINIDSGTKSNN